MYQQLTFIGQQLMRIVEDCIVEQQLSLENSADSYLCFRLALLHSVSYFFFLYRLPFLYLCRFFDSVSSNIDGVLSSNLYANVFVFGDLNVHNKDWLTYSGGTDKSGELCYNFSISNDLTQMVNFPTRISHSDSHSTALSDFFLSSGASICSKTSFPRLENSDHVVVSVSIDFPSNSQPYALFQNCLLKNFLRTLILMTQVSLYFFPLLELISNCIIFQYFPRW